MVLIFIQTSQCTLLEKMPCFRPLTGIMVLIRTLYKCLYEAVKMAFCGADQYIFIIFCLLRENDFQKIA